MQDNRDALSIEQTGGQSETLSSVEVPGNKAKV